MNNYEGIFIIKPDLKDEELNNAFKAIRESVTKSGGSILKEEGWGKKQLAYPVKKFKEGHYYRLDFSVDPAAITKLESGYGMNGDVLRTMITKR